VENGNDNNARKQQQQSSGFMSGFLPSLENFAKVYQIIMSFLVAQWWWHSSLYIGHRCDRSDTRHTWYVFPLLHISMNDV
jgi:hypothetical protein